MDRVRSAQPDHRLDMKMLLLLTQKHECSLVLNSSKLTWMLFPSCPDGHLAPSYTISRLGPRAAASNCGRRHGGYTGWRGSKNSRRGLVGEIISLLWLGRVRVRVMGRVRVRCGVWVRFIGYPEL